MLLRSSVLLVVASAVPVDKEANCPSWAEAGECDRNKAFMQANCPTACSGAKSMSSQLQKECIGYAEQGECSRNPAFMLSSCRPQCDAWERKHNLHIDRNARCVEWSMLGKCVEPRAAQPVDMASQCNTSCTVHEHCARSTYTGWSVGICDKALRCEATDKKASCASRAKLGDCSKHPAKMAVECLASCAKHDVDAVLSAQKPEMRARLSPLYDLPGSLSRSQERCWLTGWAGSGSQKLMLPTQARAYLSDTQPLSTRVD